MIPDNFYGDKLSVYYGGESTVSASDQASIIALLPSSIIATNPVTSSVSDWDKKNYDDRGVDRKGAYWFDTIGSGGSGAYKYYTQVSTISRSTPLYFTNEMNQAIIRFATGQTVNI